MRIAIAAVGQETGSFTTHRTSLEDFRQKGLDEGESILEKTAGVGCLGGFLAAAGEEDAEIVPLPIVNAWASAGGTITEDTLDFFRDKIVAGLKQMGPIDGFFFSLHGAATTDATPDFEGDLLLAAREIIGYDVPLVVPFDHHANITQTIIDAVDALVGYRTQPHDQLETGKAAAKILFSIIRGDMSPTIAWRKIPMMAHQEQFLTSRGPMKEWFDLARHMETLPGVVSVSTFPMQPWLDVPEGGWSAVVITDNDPDLADKLVVELANKAWSLRDAFWKLDSISPADAVRQAIEAPRGLVVLSDTGDSIFGGANGDSTVILRELLAQNVPEMALVSILDPQAVEIATRAGVGSEITVALGATTDPTFYDPVEVTAKVAGLASGRLKARVSSYESFDPGRVALLEAGQVRIMVSEYRGVAGNHPIVYQRFGIDPGDAKMIVVKTASNWHYYSEWISEVIRVDTPGPTMSHLEKLPWKRLPRPMYPFDEMPEWRA